MNDRRTRPSRISRDATNFAVLDGMAKQIPCAIGMIAVFTPTTSPREVTSGPPEFPGFSAASVWITLSISRPVRDRNERASELTTPAVTVALNPYGFPTATTSCPTRNEEESPSVAHAKSLGFDT